MISFEMGTMESRRACWGNAESTVGVWVDYFARDAINLVCDEIDANTGILGRYRGLSKNN